jgi:hypothetical protein
VRLILLIAIALTAAWLQGQRTLLQRQQPYVCRTQEKGRTRKRHSNFWIGLYGQNWIVAFHECQVWVEEFMDSIRNKQTFYRRGLRAMVLIQQLFSFLVAPSNVTLTRFEPVPTLGKGIVPDPPADIQPVGHHSRLLLSRFQFVLVGDIHAPSISRLESVIVFSKPSLTGSG